MHGSPASIREVRTYLKQWVHSQHTLKAMGLRLAIAQLSGTDVERDFARYANKKKIAQSEVMARLRAEGVDRLLEDHAEVIVSMIRLSRAMYPGTQVALYRGMDNVEMRGGFAYFAADSLTSFTSDLEIARRFARMHGGHVIRTRVPRDSIVISHLAFPELGRQREVLVSSDDEFSGILVHEGRVR